MRFEKVPEIPRKPKAPAPTEEQTNGTAGTGKRKRGADEAPAENGRVKRVASVSVAEGDDSHPIVLDEADGGAILIDDD